MATYYFSSVNSDLGGGADFNKELALSTSASSSIGVTVAGGATEVSYGYTPFGYPGDGGTSGDITVEVNVLIVNTAFYISTQIHRVSFFGEVLASSTISNEQQASSTGVKTFTFINPSLGTWKIGDRLRVDYRFRNANVPSLTLTIGNNTVNEEIVTPFGNPSIIPTLYPFGIELGAGTTPIEIASTGTGTQIELFRYR